MNYTNLELWRLADFLPTAGRSKTMLYSDQAKGLFPKPIKLGGETSRAAHYPKHEVQAVLAARIAGYNDEQIKALVIKLEQQRKDILSELLAHIDSAAA